jgi:hypothetical protein
MLRVMRASLELLLLLNFVINKGLSMRWALVDSNNKVLNVIVYDGSSLYEPEEGMKLREINDWVQVGLDADIREEDVPKPPIDPIDHVKEKSMRDAKYKQDLSMVALFDAARKSNPQLTFSAYLDNLEQLKSNASVDIELGS